jgi:poly(3-hydroxybutyrate) depolymerase
MLYQAYQTQADFMLPVRAGAALTRHVFAALATATRGTPFAPINRRIAASLEMLERSALSHSRLPFAISEVTINGHVVPVSESTVTSTPFATLLRFRRDSDTPLPRVLIVAPLSGHFSTLLRATVQTMVQDHEVFITDWHNARDIPLRDGSFGLEDYTNHIIGFLEAIGPGAHVLAVCQPCVSALAATAVMAEAGSPFVPKSLTLMAGPIDARVSPTAVNDLATSMPIEWFRDNVIATVPARFAGAGRRVYPGFLQVAGFVAMNHRRHIDAHWRMYDHLIAGRTKESEAGKAFYDEYFAVLDLTEEFYLETVRDVFQQHTLARGTMQHEGRTIDCRAIRHTALLTVEGERDDICAAGQTVAAHDLTPAIPPGMRAHHLQSNVGHYGVFSGRRWESEVYPIVRRTIGASEARNLAP